MTKPKNSKSKAGRPSEFSEDVVKKLEESFAIDATVEEACFYANISRQTYYNNVKEGTELFDRFKALRERPVLLARQTAVSKITESYQNAMDYLKRKRKDEFSEQHRNMVDVTTRGEKITAINYIVPKDENNPEPNA
jgi:predicted DNA-binding protein YlxM (UPF0122 family)